MKQKIKVLYIDDEKVNLDLFEYNFSGKYDVVTGCCGDFGLECLQKHPDIKVVISDMKMPNMSGLEFIKRAKSIYSDKKYFILTGFDITNEIRAALKSNLISKYFSKPFNVTEIESALDQVE